MNTYVDAERSNKYAAAKIKKDETEKCKRCFLGEKYKGRVHISIIWTTKNIRKDPDNVAFAKKFIFDGMVKAGAIETDGRKWIDSFEDDFSVNKNDPHIEVIIRELK
jgi:hypothetical protein